MDRRAWLKHYDEGVPHTLEYSSLPLHAILDVTARDHPNATSTIFYGARLTYADVAALSHRFAAGLQADGVRKGDRVALMLPNAPQYVIAYFGALRAGATVVPLNPLYTAPEVHRTLADSGAVALVVLSRMYATAVEAVRDTTVRRVVVTSIKEYMTPMMRALFTLTRERKDGHRVDIRSDAMARSFRDLLRHARQPDAVDVSPDDLAALLYTGGTTGVPKGAMLTHRAFLANAVQARAWFRDSAPGRDVSLGLMPLFHCYGLSNVLHLSVLTAAAIVLLPRFDIKELLAAVQRYRPNQFAGAPRVYVAINNAPESKRYDLRSIKVCLSGSAPLPVEVSERFESLTGGRVVEGYGLTEAAPSTHCNPLYGFRKVGSIGVPFPDVDAKIVDLQTGTRELGVGEVGELAVRGPNLMSGYWGRPEESALVLRDGWLYTGDVARMDEDGYFYIVDRKKELVIVSGFNVYPREVEEVLYAHPAVLEAAAIGVPHADRGEVVKAFVVLRPGARATSEELIEHCRGSLARYKVPASLEFRQELPKSTVGKVLRRDLAEEERAKRTAV